jgi:hypothetical protein
MSERLTAKELEDTFEHLDRHLEGHGLLQFSIALEGHITALEADLATARKLLAQTADALTISLPILEGLDIEDSPIYVEIKVTHAALAAAREYLEAHAG